tara:strand:- start:18721 stop:19002 length:282 start_codon:yes stop_codon:yes gene_type:complete
MKEGDLIIWDSHFGYDVGFYSKDKGVMYNTCEVYLITGVCYGKFSATHYEVVTFNEETIVNLNTKYNKKSDNWKFENLVERLNNTRDIYEENK